MHSITPIANVELKLHKINFNNTVFRKYSDFDNEEVNQNKLI